jgi:response regulator NasT
VPPPGLEVAALEPTVAMAVGVLMHRYSLARGPALQRLQQMADAERLSLAGQAERLLDALELLSKPAAE